MNDSEFAKVFNATYKKVATTASYSMKIAQKIGFGQGVKAIDMPREMAAKVKRFKGGCCFHHSWRLIYELEKVGITAYWAVVPEPTEERPKDQKCVVVYEMHDGTRKVADIVEDIKAKVKRDDFSKISCKRINEKGWIIDNSSIDLDEMVRISDSYMARGYLRIYPKPDNDISFAEFIQKAKYEEISI